MKKKGSTEARETQKKKREEVIAIVHKRTPKFRQIIEGEKKERNNRKLETQTEIVPSNRKAKD